MLFRSKKILFTGFFFVYKRILRFTNIQYYQGGDNIKYKYPFTKQDGLKNCACACTQMIIKYYKGYISLDDLSSKMKTGKNGTSAFQIIQTLKDIGFESNGIKTTLTEITNDNLVLPCIAHVTVDKVYEHYIVIYKIDFKKQKITIADPQNNIKKISFLEFDEIWNNILITMYPVRPIVKNEETSLGTLIIEIIKKYKSLRS